VLSEHFLKFQCSSDVHVFSNEIKLAAHSCNKHATLLKLSIHLVLQCKNKLHASLLVDFHRVNCRHMHYCIVTIPLAKLAVLLVINDTHICTKFTTFIQQFIST